MYDDALGVAGMTQGNSAAAGRYRRSAEQGLTSAQTNLGGMYALGQGVAQDYVTAHMWLNIAASSGDADAQKIRDIVQDQMTPETIGEAHRRARVCINSGYEDCD